MNTDCGSSAGTGGRSVELRACLKSVDVEREESGKDADRLCELACHCAYSGNLSKLVRFVITQNVAGRWNAAQFSLSVSSVVREKGGRGSVM